MESISLTRTEQYGCYALNKDKLGRLFRDRVLAIGIKINEGRRIHAHNGNELISRLSLNENSSKCPLTMFRESHVHYVLPSLSNVVYSFHSYSSILADVNSRHSEQYDVMRYSEMLFHTMIYLNIVSLIALLLRLIVLHMVPNVIVSIYWRYNVPDVTLLNMKKQLGK